eukprot:3757588-Amphidinium_carterae.3
MALIVPQVAMARIWKHLLWRHRLCTSNYEASQVSVNVTHKNRFGYGKLLICALGHMDAGGSHRLESITGSIPKGAWCEYKSISQYCSICGFNTGPADHTYGGMLAPNNL